MRDEAAALLEHKHVRMALAVWAPACKAAGPAPGPGSIAGHAAVLGGLTLREADSAVAIILGNELGFPDGTTDARARKLVAGIAARELKRGAK